MIGQKLYEELRSQANCWRTDKRMNGRTGHGMPISGLRANAGATKSINTFALKKASYQELWKQIVEVLLMSTYNLPFCGEIIRGPSGPELLT